MYSEKSGVISKNDDGSNAILEMELMMFKTEKQDMSSPKVSTIIIIIAGEPEGDDLEIVWDAIPFEKEKEIYEQTLDNWITERP